MSAYLPAKRPISVTLILWGVFLFGVWNVSKAILLIQSRPLFLARGVKPDPLGQAVGALVWAALFWAVAWMLKRKRPSTIHIIPLLLFAYGLYTVGIRLIFSPLSFSANGGFVMVLFFVTAVLFAFLALKRAEHRHYFVERRK